jgi:hypothetical protein
MAKPTSSTSRQALAADDYAGGGSEKPQSAANPTPQKGMIDDDMGKYGGVKPNTVPMTVDKIHERVAGGGSPGSFRGKKVPAKARGQRP